MHAASQVTTGAAEASAEAIRVLLEQCATHAATTKGLADAAKVTEERVAAYEAQLAGLQKTAEDRLKTIESLLPGAASAGLASAFNKRREHFKTPQRVWQGVFIASLATLFVIAGFHYGETGIEFGFLPKGDLKLTLEQLGLSLLYRLPFVLPLIWLAFHSSHQAALAQRLEEDYGFKETVSRSFEGYRREMAEIGGSVQPNSPLVSFCSAVLRVVTNPPDRIYERHALNKTPLNAIAESATPIAEAASKVRPFNAGQG